MKVVLFGGFLGAGKSTIIIKLVETLSRPGIGVIVNEVGEVGVDGFVMNEYGLKVKEIAGGCVCCQLSGELSSTLRTMNDDLALDLILVEATGVAVPELIVKNLELAGFNGQIMTVTVFDASRLELLSGENGPVRLIERQIAYCDLLLVNKKDLVPPEMLREAVQEVKKVNPDASLIDTTCHESGDAEKLKEVITDFFKQ